MISKRTKQATKRVARFARPNFDWEFLGLSETKDYTRDDPFVKPGMSAKIGGPQPRGTHPSELKRAAIAAADGMAQVAFESQADFNKWFSELNKKSPTFRKYYNARLRQIRKGKKAMAAKTRKTKKTRKMPGKPGSPAWKKEHARRVKAGRRKAAKKTARKPAARKAAKRRVCTKHRVRTKAWYSCIGKKGAAARKKKGKKGVRRARRNGPFILKAKANQAFAKAKQYLVPGAMVLGGFAAHRFLSALVSETIGAKLSPQYANLLSGIGTAIAGGVAANMLLKQKAAMPILGMVASAGILAIKDLAPGVANRLALAGVPRVSTRSDYTLSGMGQPIVQAAAGVGEYYSPGSLGEYVSNDMAPVGGFGEYVASSLDVQGYGDYEVQATYFPGADAVAGIDDGVHPTADLNQEFKFMEAKAGVGQPVMQAAAGMGQPIVQAAAGFGQPMPMAPGFGSDVAYASTYTPSQQAGIVKGDESPFDEGIFDIGGGNGILS